VKLLRLNDPETPKEFKIRGAQDYMCIDPATGYYWYDIYRGDREPKRLCRSTKTKNKDLAKRLAEEAVSKWLGFTSSGAKRVVRFSEVCDEQIKAMAARVQSGALRAGTLINAEIHIGKQAKAEFGHLRLDEVPNAWRRYVSEFQTVTPQKTLYNLWKHMALVWNRAYKFGYVDKPWTERNPDPKKTTGRVLTEQEKAALLDAALPQLRDQLVFAMTMGMRLREHLKLTWDRVDLSKQTITLRAEDTKTRKPRVMKMSPQVYKVLMNRWAKRKPGAQYVFPARGKPNQPTRQNKNAWASAKRRAGIRGRCRYHDLRHTFLTECAKKVRQGEVSLPLICAYAGLNITVFERVYLHLSHEDTAAVSNLIAVNLGDRENEIEIKH
jgi:integrase